MQYLKVNQSSITAKFIVIDVRGVFGGSLWVQTAPKCISLQLKNISCRKIWLNSMQTPKSKSPQKNY